MILTVTLNPALDKTLVVPTLAPEATLRATEVIHLSGGKGLNVSRALRGLGAETVAFFPSAGFTGRQLEAVCRQEGLRTAAVPVSGETRIALTCRHATSGRYFHFLEPGPEFTDTDRQALRIGFQAALEGVEAVVLSGSAPCPAAEELVPWMLETAAAGGLPVALDTHGAPLLAGLAKGPWLAKPNQQELERALNRPLTSDSARWEALAWMRAQGVEIALLSLGAEGLLAAWEGERRRVAPPRVPVVNELGAGDSMVAAVVWALLAGEGVERALRWGVAAGAANVAVWDPGRITRPAVQALLDGVTISTV